MPGQRFLYLPSAGFCWLLALGWQQASERRRPLPRRRLWIGIAALAVAYVGLSNLYQSYWRIPGDATRGMVADVRRQAPVLPPGSEIYLVNLWAPAMRLPEALRLEYHDPELRAQTLSCSPKVLPLREDQPLSPVERLYARYMPSEVGVSDARAEWTSAGALRLSLEEGRYGRTLVAGLASSHANLAAGTTIRGEGFTATVMAADPAGIRSMEF